MSISKQERDAVIGLLPFLPKNPVIFDCGSNKGLWSDIIMEQFGQECDIHFFEPNEIMLNYTRIKYDYNKNITYNLLAVSNSTGEKDFFYFTNYNNGLSSLNYNEAWNDLPMLRGKADTITVDLYAEKMMIPYIDFLKIDVEGNEINVLAGAQKMIESDKVRFIQIEYGEHWKLINAKGYNVIRRMEMIGYSTYSFNGTNYEKLTSDTFIEDYRADNFIITKHNIINHSQGWNKVFIENTKDIKSDFVLEIGSCEGLTAKHICENILKPGGRLICVDPLEDYYIKPDDMPEMVDQYYRWLRNTKELPINLYRKKFAGAYDELKDFRFDFIYIDGDHSYEAVYHDAVKSWFVLKKGGYILFDDYDGYTDGTTKGIDKFLHENKSYYELIIKNYQVLIKKK